MKPSLNPRQEAFVKRIMKPYNSMVPDTNPIYWEFVMKLFNEQYLSPTSIATPGAREMMLAVVERIQYAYLDDELERVLLEVNSIPEYELSTKQESFKKTKVNSSKGHHLILSTLNNYPDSLSRTEIANITGLRVSAVCARVVELIEEGKIKVVGTKQDNESDRKVEVLGLV